MHEPQSPRSAAEPGIDAELQALSRGLARYSAQARGLEQRLPPVVVIRRPPRSWGHWIARPLGWAMAAVLVVALGWTWRLSWPEGRAWPVRAGAKAHAAWVPHTWLQARAGVPLEVSVARIGRVLLSPGSQVQLLDTGTGHHRMALREGHLRARIWAPPGHFGVSLDGIDVVDLGCDFEIWRDAHGFRVHVRHGWVAVRGATVGVGSSDDILVPGGYQVAGGLDGVGLPLHRDAPPVFVQALRAVTEAAPSPSVQAVQRLVTATRDVDAYTLLVLLQQHPQLASGPLYDRLRQALRLSPPSMTERAAWIRLEPAVVEQAWQQLPVQPKQWWRGWRDVW